MTQKLKLGLAATVATATALVASVGFGGSASAGSDCWYTGHGTANDACSHRSIVWEQTLINNDGHFHQYKHDVKWGSDHHPWKWISA